MQLLKKEVISMNSCQLQESLTRRHIASSQAGQVQPPDARGGTLVSGDGLEYGVKCRAGLGLGILRLLARGALLGPDAWCPGVGLSGRGRDRNLSLIRGSELCDGWL